jgi:hypothetical protein
VRLLGGCGLWAFEDRLDVGRSVSRHAQANHDQDKEKELKRLPSGVLPFQLLQLSFDVIGVQGTPPSTLRDQGFVCR